MKERDYKNVKVGLVDHQKLTEFAKQSNENMKDCIGKMVDFFIINKLNLRDKVNQDFEGILTNSEKKIINRIDGVIKIIKSLEKGVLNDTNSTINKSYTILDSVADDLAFQVNHTLEKEEEKEDIKEGKEELPPIQNKVKELSLSEKDALEIRVEKAEKQAKRGAEFLRNILNRKIGTKNIVTFNNEIELKEIEEFINRIENV